MASALDNLDTKLNQNLWGLVVGLGVLGAAEYFKLTRLGIFALVLCSMMTLSIAVTTIAYTIKYWKGKLGKD